MSQTDPWHQTTGDPWTQFRANPRSHGTFPIFEWNEDSSSSSKTETDKVYHSSARLSGEEGLLIDTGSLGHVQGLKFVERQTADAAQHGNHTQWKNLDKIKTMSGIGEGVEHCTRSAKVFGCVAEGDVIEYEAPVLEGTGAEVPPLYGLEPMARDNVYFGTRTGVMHRIPEGTDDQIVFPPGTKTIKCSKAKSGHWMLPISKWNAKKSETVKAYPAATAEGRKFQ